VCEAMVESGNHTSRVHVKRVDATSLQPVTCHCPTHHCHYYYY
jgi:hypothetical protein